MYSFKCYNRHTKDFKFEITKEGHTMLPEDIIKDLNRMKYLEKEYARLRSFIINGYEYGYIEIMPIDEDDSAYDTFTSLFGEKEAKRMSRKCGE